jgi:hypothetical protein
MDDSSTISSGLFAAANILAEKCEPTLIQGGGSVKSFTLDPSVERVQIMLKAPNGRNMKAQIELMQGPNNDKQVIEYYASNRKKNPLFAVMETPGAGNTVRLINEYPMEFPLYAWVEPFPVDGSGQSSSDIVAVGGSDCSGGSSATGSSGSNWWDYLL